MYISKLDFVVLTGTTFLIGFVFGAGNEQYKYNKEIKELNNDLDMMVIKNRSRTKGGES